MRRFADASVRRRATRVMLVRQVAAAIAFAALWLVPVSSGYGDAAGAVGSRIVQSDALPRGELFIDTARGERRFEIEIARTGDHRRRGLMFRAELAADAGMLFVYQGERDIVMWMKNTLISLDMLFIDGDGRIARIAERTTPMSEERIRSGGPMRAVLELRGGTVNLLRIKPGNRVRSEALNLGS